MSGPRPIVGLWFPDDLPLEDRPDLTDLWILARPKVKYYGSFPAGFLQRARDLLGVDLEQAVLHVCGGEIRQYPFRGLGPNDKTLDLDPDRNPDFLQDARDPLPYNGDLFWDAILIDRPYTPEDAEKYAPGRDALPPINALLKDALRVVKPLGKVGVFDYIGPRPPKHNVRFVAAVGVWCGFDNRIRIYTVFERLA